MRRALANRSHRLTFDSACCEQALKTETEGKSTLIGFVGAPWTLAAYSIEGGSSKHALNTKKMMMEEPALFHSLMTKYANSIGDYACYQVR